MRVSISFPWIVVTQPTVQPAHHSPSTDSTDPARLTVDHPIGRPVHRLPPLGPTLGTRPGGPLSPAPLPGPRFLFFVFRPVWQGPTTRAAHLTRDQKRSAQPRCSRVWARCSSRRASAPKGLGSLRWRVSRGDPVVCRSRTSLALVHLVDKGAATTKRVVVIYHIDYKRTNM